MDERRIDFLRHEIGIIDRQILDLLKRRAHNAIEIGRLKKENGLPLFDPNREQDVIEAILSENSGPLPKSAIRNIFREIISASRALQVPIKVSFLGPLYTFSHMAVVERFGSSCELVPEPSIFDVFQDVERGSSTFGVVPVENSTEGSVNLTLDLLLHSNLKVSGEIYIKVVHSLISRENDLNRIDRVFSHPQAIGQCRQWIQRNLPERELIEVASTADAVKMAREEKGSAAIGSEFAALHYGLGVLMKEIQDSPFNSTRFLVLGREISKRTGRDKTSICFTLPHRPGSLYRALEPFAVEGINLTRLESRPTKERPWEYHFFADMEGYITDEKVKRALDELRMRVESIKVLGSYPVGER